MTDYDPGCFGSLKKTNQTKMMFSLWYWITCTYGSGGDVDIACIGPAIKQIFCENWLLCQKIEKLWFRKTDIFIDSLTKWKLTSLNCLQETVLFFAKIGNIALTAWQSFWKRWVTIFFWQISNYMTAEMTFEHIILELTLQHQTNLHLHFSYSTTWKVLYSDY